MADIVERLRKDKWHVSGVDCETAAQEIERLRAELAQLRQYLDTAQRRASALGDEVAGLREALQSVLPWVVTQEVACNGLKCREAVCMSCNSDSEANAQLACDAYAKASDALAARKGTT